MLTKHSFRGVQNLVHRDGKVHSEQNMHQYRYLFVLRLFYEKYG